jgi:hypothetical protein
MNKESKVLFFIEGLQPKSLKNNQEKIFYAFFISSFLLILFFLLDNFIFTPMIEPYNSLLWENTPTLSSNNYYFAHQDKSTKIFSTVYTGAFYCLYTLYMGWKLIVKKPFFLLVWARKFLDICYLKFRKKPCVKYLVKLYQKLFKAVKSLKALYEIYYDTGFSNWSEATIQPVVSIGWSLDNLAKNFKIYLTGTMAGLALIFLTSSIFSATILLATIPVFIPISTVITVYGGMPSPASLLEAAIQILAVFIVGMLAMFSSLIMTVLSIFVAALFIFVLFVILSLEILPGLLISSGLTFKISVDKTYFPNQGIWRSLQNMFYLA